MPLDVRAFGPPPLKQMTEDFTRAYKQTVDFWTEDFRIKPLTSVTVTAAGPVTQDDNVGVSAILVEHPPVKPALGYRFDLKDRSIAFSGDTAASAVWCQPHWRLQAVPIAAAPSPALNLQLAIVTHV